MVAEDEEDDREEGVGGAWGKAAIAAGLGPAPDEAPAEATAACGTAEVAPPLEGPAAAGPLLEGELSGEGVIGVGGAAVAAPGARAVAEAVVGTAVLSGCG